MTTPRIGIIVSTIREGRFGHTATEWIRQLAEDTTDLRYDVVDLRDFHLPLHGDPRELDPLDPHGDVVRRWVRTMNEFDGYIFVTAEYNHSIPGVLKNALDYLGSQLHRKPAAFVGYGPIGSARAIEQLRLILVEFQMAPLRNAVHIGIEPYIAVTNDNARLGDFDFLHERARLMLDELAWWTRALLSARQYATPSRTVKVAIA
jgi:NAD(P)H-dependent FMN reductase